MKLHALAASVLLACAKCTINEHYERDLDARALVVYGPSGICPAVPNVTITLQPVVSGTTISYVTVTDTQTVTNGGGTATTTGSGMSAYTPPFNGGQGLPSGFVTDLPFASFFFLAYSTPGAAAPTAPVAKRDELERRQNAQVTASPIKLVDLTTPTTLPPNLVGADTCDFATPLDLVRGVLNGKGFSIGKLLDSTNAVLGALINPPDNQVNLTFAISGGRLQWNAPDVGGATFYNCAGTIYAGFPNLAIAGCVEVIVSPIAGQVCISYVQSSRTANPDFTAPLGASSTSAVSGATATGTGNTATGGSGASSTGSDNGNGSGSATATGSGNGNGNGSGSTTATGSDNGNGNGSGSTSGTASSSDNGNGNNGSGSTLTTSTVSGSGGSDVSTTSSSALVSSSAAVAGQDCLFTLPASCTTGLAGITIGGSTTPVNTCATDLLLQLSLDGAARAATCLTTAVLSISSGLDITNCLNRQLLCFSGSSSATRNAPSASGSVGPCLATLPQACGNLGTANVGQVLDTVLACATSLDGQLNLAGTTNAATCLFRNLVPGLTQGTTILGCLQTRVLCFASSTTSPMPLSSMSSTNSASASSSSASCLIPLPNQCKNLVNPLSLGGATSCAVAAVAALAGNPALTTVQACVNAFTGAILALTPGAGNPANLLACFVGSGLICAA